VNSQKRQRVVCGLKFLEVKIVAAMAALLVGQCFIH
jgi:hypothetical protein